MEFPVLKPIDFSTFLNQIGIIKDLLAKAVPRATDPDQREMLQSFLSQIHENEAEFSRTAEHDINEIITKYDKSVADTKMLLNQNTQLMEETKELGQKIDEAVVKIKAKAADKAKQPKAPAIRPRGVARKTNGVSAPLDSGKALRNYLLGLRNPADEALDGPHTTGNIWDNWKPGDSSGKPNT